MTSMEKKLTENRLTEVKAALSAKYRTVDLGGEKFFVATDGAFFRVGAFPGAMALVIEYADTEQEATHWRTETVSIWMKQLWMRCFAS